MDADKLTSEAARRLSSMGASKGGQERARKLTPDERSKSASLAARGRWLPRATHDGALEIGGSIIPCAVLEDGTRLLSETGVVTALGLYRSGAVHVRARDDSGRAHLPLFVAHRNLRPFVDSELEDVLSKPIWYRPKEREKGTRAKGLNAKLIPKVLEVWLNARDAGVLHGERQKAVALKADILMRGLAQVGIIALVDEATGYQDERARDELTKILEAYVSQELLKWTKRFPTEFFRQLFRVHGWEFKEGQIRGPRYVGKLIKKLVYEQLPPNVLPELEKLNPPIARGRRRHKHHQFLTEDIGNPHLERQVLAVTTILRVARDKTEFFELCERAFPKSGQQLRLAFPETGDQ